MNCKRCGAVLYGESGRCFTCGYAEADVTRERELVVTINKRRTRRIVKYAIVLFFFGWLFYHFFLYIDPVHGCFITIRPALVELSNTTMKKGLRYLRDNFPNQYQLTCDNISSIDPNISCGGFGGGCYSGYLRDSPDVIDISTTFGNYKNAAKVIIHETCHRIQFKEHRSFDEVECHKKDEVIPWQGEAFIQYQ